MDIDRTEGVVGAVVEIRDLELGSRYNPGSPVQLFLFVQQAAQVRNDGKDSFVKSETETPMEVTGSFVIE